MEALDAEGALLLVVENVLRQKPFWAVVGDLFLTTQGLYFVPYQQFQCAGGLGGAAGALIGGLAGGITVAVGDKQNAGHAISKAAEIRVRRFGLSLKERMSGDRWSVSIPKDDIASLELSKNSASLICRTHNGQSTEVILPNLNERQVSVIREYLKPTTTATVVLDSTQYGFDLPYPSPTRLLKLYSSGQSPLPQEIRDISDNGAYLNNLYSLLKQMKKPELVRACQAISDAKSPLRPRIIEIARKEKREIPKTKNSKIMFGCMGFFIILLVAIDIQCLASHDIGDFIGDTVLFLGVIGFCIGGVLWPMRKPKAIIRILSQ
jgi:hypothetical protein